MPLILTVSPLYSKEAVCNAEEQVRDLEHVEVLQKKFDDFQKVSRL